MILTYNLTHQAGLHRRKIHRSRMHRICAMLPPCCPHCGSCQSHCGRFRAASVRGRCAPVIRHCCRSILRTVCTALELLPAMERGDQEVFLRLPSGVAVGTVDLPSVLERDSPVPLRRLLRWNFENGMVLGMEIARTTSMERFVGNAI